MNLLQDQTSRERVIQSLASMSSSQIVSATSLHHKSFKPSSSSSSSSAAAAATARTTVDNLRHANYHSHNGFTNTTVCLTSLHTFDVSVLFFLHTKAVCHKQSFHQHCLSITKLFCSVSDWTILVDILIGYRLKYILVSLTDCIQILNNLITFIK